MARPDLHRSHGSVSPRSPFSCKTEAAESIHPPYASADSHPPTTMTKPLYDQPHAPNDGQFYPTYPEFYDLNNVDPSAAAAPGGGGGQPAGVNPAISQTEGGYPYGWDYGLSSVELAFPPSPAGFHRGEEGDGLQHQATWDCRSQLEAYPPMMGNAIAMADPMSQYVSVGDSMGGTMPAAHSMSQYVAAEDSMGGSYESPSWPPPLMGQISPSPSQSSYQVSSLASGSGAQFSRHNSCSSLPASRAAAIEQTRLDARFQPVPDQAVSPGETQLPSGGAVANGGSHTLANFSSSTDRKTASPWRNTKNQTITATTTTDCNAGTVSPAMTPSPKDSNPGRSQQTASRNARGPSDHRPRKASALPAPARTAKQKKTATTAAAAPPGRGQGQQQAQLQPTPAPQPKPAPHRVRNREAANKCRAKSKLAVADLESTEREMGSEHRELSATARGLRDEVLLLKNELLAHGNCDDSLIQQYLTYQARLVGAGGPVLDRHQQHQRYQHQQGARRP